MYKTAIIAAAIAACTSCGSETKEIPANTDTATHIVQTTTDTILTNTIDTDTSEHVTVYIVVADTGQNYYKLRDRMYSISSALHWPIDTMGRYYNKKKQEIVLPDDDSDEMYRGEYFPRRYPGETLSLEYYCSYTEGSTLKNIALIAGICETEQRADSLLAVLKANVASAFVYRTKIYMGCVH